MEWYKTSVLEVLKTLETSLDGLQEKDIEKRREMYGRNEIAQEESVATWKIFLEQYKDLLVIVLIIAGILSGVTGEWVSAIVIFVVITMNAILGTIQTLKAEQSLQSLKQMSVPQVKVLRQGEVHLLASTELTVGDIVLIEAGDVIEGDGRLIEASQLQVNESALTGESLPQEKFEDVLKENCALADRKNMVYASTLVTNGTGRYVVTSIGMQTEIGKIASMLQKAQSRKTPLQLALDAFSTKLTISICIICAFIMFLNIFVAHEPWMEALLIAIALAVAAIPEALGSIVTIVLSISTQKMVREHAIIKELNAVESLGCVSVICSDKTGTLTQNKMKVVDLLLNLTHVQALDVEDECHRMFLKTSFLCNNAVIHEEESIGDPTEIALMDLYLDTIKKYPSFEVKDVRMKELPFDSVRKKMSVSTEDFLFTKGALDTLLDQCDSILIHDTLYPLKEEQKKQILAENDAYASEGLRVLAFAYKTHEKSTLDFEDEDHLVFIGLAAQQDPPRVESKKAVEQCIQAGIRPIMITGDHIVTARSIAQQIGILRETDVCLSGDDLEKMNDAQLDAILERVSVYARVAPEHKLRIVKAWQKKDEIVAMTGDGVNDAPALKQSDIGVAMGITGTEVSKDAASMILMDDNFATIVQAVVTGRNVYANIKHAIIYLLSGNFSAVLAVLYTSVLLLPTPFMAIHLLFINLITDSLPAVAIGMEAGSLDVLKEKPRRKTDALLNRKTMSKILVEGCIICLFVMISYYLGLQKSPLMASTMAFGTLCLARLFHGLSSRSERPLYQLKVNVYSLYALLIGFILLTAILLIPSLHGLFSIAAVSFIDYLYICLSAFASFIVIQLTKILRVI